jgi:hypothetical protein
VARNPMPFIRLLHARGTQIVRREPDQRCALLAANDYRAGRASLLAKRSPRLTGK